MKNFNRRDFVKASMAGLGTAVISSGLSARVFMEGKKVRVEFNYGVASGDPLSDRVILWTHVTTANNKAVRVHWQVRDDSTDQVVVNGSKMVDESTGHTLKVDAVGLLPDRRYRYKFWSNGVFSEEGLTRTLPEGSGVSRVSLAVVSCSNYPAGFFHVYREIAGRNDLNAVLHLGDYIYEYGEGGYATGRAEELGRTFPVDNNTEILTLTDYRKRYALYRSDHDLQACHRSHPFISVWDDHEITNDAWRSGAENHGPDEGDYEERKMQALQAYFEWMPIRVNPFGDGYRSWRTFRFGDLIDLFMLDTRIEGRDVQLDYADFLVNGTLDGDSLALALADPTRTMLGQEQLQWLQTELATSTATWQVLGQQVLMGRMLLPAAIATQALSIQQFSTIASTAQLAARAQAGDPTLTPGELAFLAANQHLLTPENLALIQLPSIPYNLDAWDGYGYEREVLLNTARAAGCNLVVLAGDTHNAWANNLETLQGEAVGVELATSSVTSPGLEDYLQIPDRASAPAIEDGITQLVEGLKYTNVYDRGYMTVEFTPASICSQWHFVDSVFNTSYSMLADRSHSVEITNDGSPPGFS